MKKGFTLLEIIITLLVAFILVTVGGVSYRLVLEKARARVDEVNKQTLLKTMKVASLEAGVLGQLDIERDLQHIGNAYAEVMKESGWFTKFSYFFVRLNTPREVYANVGKYVDPQYMKKYGVDPQVFISPLDKNGPPSYGINAALEGLKWDEIDPGTIVIGDCDNVTFTNVDELAFRHYSTLESLLSNTPETQVILNTGKVLIGTIADVESEADEIASEGEEELTPTEKSTINGLNCAVHGSGTATRHQCRSCCNDYCDNSVQYKKGKCRKHCKEDLYNCDSLPSGSGTH